MEKQGDTKGSIEDLLKQAQIDNFNARTRSTELDIAEREGELMLASAHVDQINDIVKYFATFLDTLPDA